MPLGRRPKRKGKDELRWSWVVARATCPLHERLRVGDVAELHLIEMEDKKDKMDNVMASRYSPMTLVLTGNERAAMTRLNPNIVL